MYKNIGAIYTILAVIYLEIATINASIGIFYAIIDAICASMCITTAADTIKLSTVVIYECPI
jgi:hypothetical protein